MKEVSNALSLLPGELVQALVTAIEPSGVTTQVLGSFTGTIDLYHFPDSKRDVKVGGKIKARILYEVAGSTPPQFALSLCEHVLNLEPRKILSGGETVEDAYPTGTHLSSVKVKRVESERGVLVEVSEGVDGFVHVRAHCPFSSPHP